MGRKDEIWGDLHPEEISIIRQAVSTGQPITNVRYARAAIAHAERELRPEYGERSIPLIGAAGGVWLIVLCAVHGQLVGVLLGGVLALACTAWFRVWGPPAPSPRMERVEFTKASAERLLDEGP